MVKQLGDPLLYDQDMSLSERTKSRQSPDPYVGGVSRSRSFAGLLSHRRTASASAAFTTACSTDGSSVSSGTSSNSSSLSHGGTIGPVLGQSYSPNTARHLIQGLSATWSGKPPKAPRPERAQIIFEAVSKGLRESINLTQNDISSLRAAVDSVSISSSQSQGRLYELEKQMKSAERYLKKLEFQLSKLEELKEQYDVQQKMRDGIRTMAYAYVLSPGKERGSALHSVRSGFKECTDLLCAIEAKLERMMGTLLFEMKGIQGFARLCSGDVFEIIIKHGDQKWKSRGRIFKNNKQTWENQRILFKSLFSEPLYIKALEVRGLGKNVLLGNKYCETRDLFSAHPQQMTINLNPSGSLKLNLIITWNQTDPLRYLTSTVQNHSAKSPLHGVIDETSMKPIPPLLAALSSPLNRRRPPPPIQEAPDTTEVSLHTKTELSQHYLHSPDTDFGQGFSSGSTSASTSAQSSAIASPDVEVMAVTSGDVPLRVDEKLSSSCGSVISTTIPSSQSKHTDGSSLRQVDSSFPQRWSTARSGDSSECCSIDMGSSSVDSHLDVSSLRDVLQSLISSLEDIQGQYPELHELHQHVLELDKLLKKTFQRRGSASSNISISIESALGCFDFLNSAIDGDDSESTDEKSIEEKNDPEMTAKTSDSGIASIAHQLLDDGERMSPNLDPSPQPLTTGLEQLDVTLTTHLLYCLRLTEHLGSFGPLKCQEMFSLDKLRRQSSSFSLLLKFINSKEDKNMCTGLFFVEEDPELQQLWLQLTGDGQPLCLMAEQLLPQVEKAVKSLSGDTANSLAAKVSAQLLCQIMDVNKFDPEANVTVLQFSTYFSSSNCSVNSLIKEMVEEVKMVEDLKSKDISQITRAILAMKRIIPSADSLFAIGHLFLESSAPLTNLAESYLKDVGKSSSVKEKVTTTYLEGLESENHLTRQGSCHALGVLQALDCVEQLAYMSYADENADVRQEAKDALFRFGDDGRKLYEDSQLFIHGFQGLNMK